MADNVAVTPGLGATIGTDEKTIGGTAVQVQRVALSLGPEGAHTAPGSGRVVGAGTDGAIYTDNRPKMIRVGVTPTVSTAPYSVKDAVGNPMTFAGAARYSGGSVRLESVQIVDKGEGLGPVDLYLFDRSTTGGGLVDNNAFTATDTQMEACVGVVRFTAADHEFVAGGNDIWHRQVGTSFPLLGTDLFGILMARAIFTLTSNSDLVVTLNLYQD